MRPTLKDAEVIFVDGDGKFVSGVIQESYSQGAARIDLTPRKKTKDGTVAADSNRPLGSVTAQATYSETGEPGTFHYPDQGNDVKEAIADRAPKPQSSAPAGK